MDYTLWLPNGTQLQQGTVRTETTQGGARGFTEGWQLGIQGMKHSEVRRLVIPSRLGYGGETYGPIPAHSVLVFEVRLAGLR